MKLSHIFKDSIIEEAKKIKKPSSGLTKKQKSAVSKKAKAGKDIGKKGKGFEKVAKAAGGGEKGKKIAAAAMWKNIKRIKEASNVKGMDEEKDPEGQMAKVQLKKIAGYAAKISKELKDESQLDAWVQDHIAKASELMDQVGHFIDGKK